MTRRRWTRDLRERIAELEQDHGRPVVGGEAVDIMAIEIERTDPDGEPLGTLETHYDADRGEWVSSSTWRALDRDAGGGDDAVDASSDADGEGDRE